MEGQINSYCSQYLQVWGHISGYSACKWVSLKVATCHQKVRLSLDLNMFCDIISKYVLGKACFLSGWSLIWWVCLSFTDNENTWASFPKLQTNLLSSDSKIYFWKYKQLSGLLKMLGLTYGVLLSTLLANEKGIAEIKWPFNWYCPRMKFLSKISDDFTWHT